MICFAPWWRSIQIGPLVAGFGVFSLIAMFAVAIPVIAAFWVHQDARARGTDPGISLAWALLSFFFFIPVFILYLVLREHTSFVGPEAFRAAATRVSAGGGVAPAGWYPDPTTPDRQRFWDGSAWSA